MPCGWCAWTPAGHLQWSRALRWRGGGPAHAAHPLTFPAAFTGKWSPQGTGSSDPPPRAPSALDAAGRTGLPADGLAQG